MFIYHLNYIFIYHLCSTFINLHNLFIYTKPKIKSNRFILQYITRACKFKTFNNFSIIIHFNWFLNICLIHKYKYCNFLCIFQIKNGALVSSTRPYADCNKTNCEYSKSKSKANIPSLKPSKSV